MSMATPAPAPGVVATRPKTTFFRHLSPSVAQKRFKANVFGLFLVWFFESVFTPYRTLRRGIIWFMDEKIQGRVGAQRSWAGSGISSLETILALMLLWNIVEAGLALRYPQPQAFVPYGMQITPIKPSSPLTRTYTPPTKHTTPTPAPGSPLANLLARVNTPSDTHPSRLSASSLQRTSSPLSASTAKILNLPSRDPNNSPSESNGLFFNPGDTASPSKVGRPQPPPAASTQTRSMTAATSAAPPGGSGGTTSDGEFVLVDRAEREWADNVWKGVRGKGGKIGI